MSARRMWINAPSKHQPDHKNHGRRVIVPDTGHQFPSSKLVYWISGECSASEVLTSALSEGWPATSKP